MHLARTNVLVFVSLALTTSLFAQQTASPTAQRDPHASTLLQQSVATLAPTPPADSTATGNVTITAGSETTQGTVRILTKGNTESSIQFQTSSTTWSIIFANGHANRVDPAGTSVLPVELAASSQCLCFPQPYLAGLLNNRDISLEFIGQESFGSTIVNHIRVHNTFQSAPDYQFLSEFTVADIWLDAASALPVKIATTRRHGRV